MGHKSVQTNVPDDTSGVYSGGVTLNHVEHAIRAGRAQFGSLLNFGDPLVAELMASVGLKTEKT